MLFTYIPFRLLQFELLFTTNGSHPHYPHSYSFIDSLIIDSWASSTISDWGHNATNPWLAALTGEIFLWETWTVLAKERNLLPELSW